MNTYNKVLFYYLVLLSYFLLVNGQKFGGKDKFKEYKYQSNKRDVNFVNRHYFPNHLHYNPDVLTDPEEAGPREPELIQVAPLPEPIETEPLPAEAEPIPAVLNPGFELQQQRIGGDNCVCVPANLCDANYNVVQSGQGIINERLVLFIFSYIKLVLLRNVMFNTTKPNRNLPALFPIQIFPSVSRYFGKEGLRSIEGNKNPQIIQLAA